MRLKEFVGYARKAFAAGAVAAGTGLGTVTTIQVNAPDDVVFPWYWYAIATLIPYLLAWYTVYQTRNEPDASNGEK